MQNKELLTHFRVYRKRATTAQTDGRIATVGPLYTGMIIEYTMTI